jgi:hypothetical protein
MLAHTPFDSRSEYFKRGGGPTPSLGGVVTARRPLQRPRLSCRYSGASTALLRGSSAPRRCCATAASAVASQLPLQRCFYSLYATGVAAPRRSLRDCRFSGRVSAAASAVLLQSCVHVVGLGHSTSLLRDGHFTGFAYAVVAPKY